MRIHNPYGEPVCRLENSVYPCRIWLAMTRFCLVVKNWNHVPRNKFHAIRRFPTGSFAVYIGDHLWSNLGIISGLGIICGRGSFAALYSTSVTKFIKFSCIFAMIIIANNKWDMWVINQAWGQYGWILAKLFCVFMDWEVVEVYK